jgi:thiamine-monophosphate kinase
MPLSEFDVIDRYFKRSPKHSSVIKSIGDDCAVLTPPENSQLLVSMDTMVAGKHFFEGIQPQHLASRAFCAALSDLAAMGAEPLWFTLSLTLPELNDFWLQSFSESLFEVADQYHCELVGGDTTQGPLTVTIQVHGWINADKALRRDGAKVGDWVFVTGSLGDGAAALQLIQKQSLEKKLSEAEKQYLLNRFYCPEPQIEIGKLIKDYAHAAIDISDGLAADASHIAKQSQVDIELEFEKVPISSASKKIAGEDIMRFALAGGDDYQLIFTVPENNVAQLENVLRNNRLQAAQIGRVKPCGNETPQARVFFDKQQIQLDKIGYEHFVA